MNRRGVTLIEVTISAILLSIVLGAVYLSIESTMTAERTGVATAQIEQDGRRVLDDIALDLRSSAAAQVTIANVGGVYSLTANQNLGFASGSITWGTPVTWTLAYGSGETDNGVDDDIDGLVDEMVITRTQNGVTLTKAENVVENSFMCVISNNAVDITLLMQTTDAKRNVVQRTHSTSVAMRNN